MVWGMARSAFIGCGPTQHPSGEGDGGYPPSETPRVDGTVKSLYKARLGGVRVRKETWRRRGNG